MSSGHSRSLYHSRLRPYANSTKRGPQCHQMDSLPLEEDALEAPSQAARHLPNSSLSGCAEQSTHDSWNPFSFMKILNHDVAVSQGVEEDVLAISLTAASKGYENASLTWISLTSFGKPSDQQLPLVDLPTCHTTHASSSPCQPSASQ